MSKFSCSAVSAVIEGGHQQSLGESKALREDSGIDIGAARTPFAQAARGCAVVNEDETHPAGVGRSKADESDATCVKVCGTVQVHDFQCERVHIHRSLASSRQMKRHRHVCRWLHITVWLCQAVSPPFPPSSFPASAPHLGWF